MPEYIKEIVPNTPEELPEFLERELRRIQDMQDVLATKLGVVAAFTIAGYGGLNLNSNTLPVPMADIPTTGYVKITAYDEITFADPRGIVQDLVNNAMKLNFEGKWLLTIIISFEHDENNAGRSFELQIWDETNLAEVAKFEIFIARNQPGTTISLPVVSDVPIEAVDSSLVLRMGEASVVIANVEIQTLTWGISSVGEFTGALDELLAVQ